MRTEIQTTKNNSILIIADSLTNESITQSVGILSRIGNLKHKSLVILLEESLYEADIDDIFLNYKTQNSFDNIFLIQNQFQITSDYSQNSKIRIFQSSFDFIEKYKTENLQNIVLIGNKSENLQEISKFLSNKKRNTRFEIDLNSLMHNLKFYKSIVNKDTMFMLMVKAFGYGQLSNKTSSILNLLNADYLGVAYTDEGVELRTQGIKSPIVVMSPESNAIESLITYDLEPEIFNFELLENIISILKRKNIRKYPVHIKFDTGMKRLGFDISETSKVIYAIKETPYLEVKSVFTHLAGTDEQIHDDFTRNQIRLLNIIYTEFEQNFNHKILKHALNSSGIERFPEYSFDMVRLGIGLYGFSPENKDKLLNVGSLKTEIIQIKTVEKGETIGYSRAGKTFSQTKIAILPLGYADGINRSMSNGKVSFMLKNTLVPTIGNVCMDLTMIDITGIDAEVGDEVLIFGENLRASKQARLIGTIAYEIITGISQRVNRVFVSNDEIF